MGERNATLSTSVLANQIYPRSSLDHRFEQFQASCDDFWWAQPNSRGGLPASPCCPRRRPYALPLRGTKRNLAPYERPVTAVPLLTSAAAPWRPSPRRRRFTFSHSHEHQITRRTGVTLPYPHTPRPHPSRLTAQHPPPSPHPPAPHRTPTAPSSTSTLPRPTTPPTPPSHSPAPSPTLSPPGQQHILEPFLRAFTSSTLYGAAQKHTEDSTQTCTHQHQQPEAHSTGSEPARSLTAKKKSIRIRPCFCLKAKGAC